MEILKTTENMECDVIYADGTRRHVEEGILYEVNDGEIIFHKGTINPAVVAAAAEDVLKYLRHIGPGLKMLAVGMCLEEESRSALWELIAYGLQLMDPERPVKQAIFRLGQMDMQASICDMLRAMANGAAEGIRPGLTLAADLVESMEVGHADS